MHEISLCESIREMLEEQALKDRFTEVKRVRVEIGTLSCVEPEALRFGFDAVMRGSLAEHAELEIVSSPARALCLTCLQEVPVTRRFDACCGCGAFTLHVMSGEEMRVIDLEVV